MFPPPQSRERRRNVLVLVADSDDDYAEVVAETLRFGGHQVAVASTPAGALRWLEQARPDLLITEYAFPDGSGVDLLRSAKRVAGERFPVIFLSAPPQPSAVVAAFANGGDDFVRKPFDPSVLLARVHAVTQASRRASRGR